MEADRPRRGRLRAAGRCRDLKDLLRQFAGQAVTIEAITDYVIVSTPFASTHVKRSTLAEMQKQGLISSPNQERKNTYPDGTIVVFPPIQARRTQ